MPAAGPARDPPSGSVRTCSAAVSDPWTAATAPPARTVVDATSTSGSAASTAWRSPTGVHSGTPSRSTGVPARAAPTIASDRRTRSAIIGMSRSPSGVGDTPVRERTNSAPPRVRSIRRSWVVRLGCGTDIEAAAAEMLPAAAMQVTTSACRSSSLTGAPRRAPGRTGTA